MALWEGGRGWSTCWDVQHVSGFPSVRYFFPTDLFSVELTLQNHFRNAALPLGLDGGSLDLGI